MPSAENTADLASPSFRFIYVLSMCSMDFKMQPGNDITWEVFHDGETKNNGF